MNIQAKHPTTPDDFLRWNEGREGKREFVRGKVVEMMINVTRNHVEIATNLILALGPQLDRTQFTLGSADFGVRTPEGIRYPDVFVDRKRQGVRGIDLAAAEPVLLAEVLSPSSFARDFIEKNDDYQRIASLTFYLILSHQEARVWLFQREGDIWTGPHEFAGTEAVVELTGGLRASVPLAEIYEGINF